MLDYVIEHIDKLPLSSDDKLDLFRILAEMCPFSTEFDRPKERLAKLFNCNLIQISNWFQNHRVSFNIISFFMIFYHLFDSVELKTRRN